MYRPEVFNAIVILETCIGAELLVVAETLTDAGPIEYIVLIVERLPSMISA